VGSTEGRLGNPPEGSVVECDVVLGDGAAPQGLVVISWRIHKWAFMALVAMAAGVVASCSASKHPSFPPPSDLLRGSRLTAVECPAPTRAGSAMTLRVSEVTAVLLCPLAVPPLMQGGSVTLSQSNPAFVGLLTALAAADIKANKRIACPAYADIPQTVQAETASAVMVVHIPVDECGHYQQGALFALMRARFGFKRVGVADNGRTISLRPGEVLDITLPPPPVTKGWQAPKVSVATVLPVLSYHAPSVGGFTAALRAQQPGRTQVVVSYRCSQGACNGWGIWVEVSD